MCILLRLPNMDTPGSYSDTSELMSRQAATDKLKQLMWFVSDNGPHVQVAGKQESVGVTGL